MMPAGIGYRGSCAYEVRSYFGQEQFAIPEDPQSVPVGAVRKQLGVAGTEGNIRHTSSFDPHLDGERLQPQIRRVAQTYGIPNPVQHKSGANLSLGEGYIP